MTIDELKAEYNEVFNEKDHIEQAKRCRELLDDSLTYVFEDAGKPRPKKATMLELLDNRIVFDYVHDTEVIEGLHFVRKLGINALHEKKIRKKEVKLAVENMAGFIGFIIDKASGKDIKYHKIYRNQIANFTYLDYPLTYKFK